MSGKFPNFTHLMGALDAQRPLGDKESSIHSLLIAFAASTAPPLPFFDWPQHKLVLPGLYTTKYVSLRATPLLGVFFFLFLPFHSFSPTFLWVSIFLVSRI